VNGDGGYNIICLKG